MPQCGDGGRHGEGLIHSTGLQKPLFAPQFGKPRFWRGFLFREWHMPNKRNGATRGRGLTRTERAGRADERVAGRAEVRVRDDTTLADGDDGRGAELAATVRRQLELLGEDPDRAGLVKTPERVAKSLSWLTRGYELDAKQVIGDALFDDTHENMVMVRDIELYSLCEHHLLPFFGRAHIAYIPRGRIVGLSKLPRVVEVFARRLQVQERLTEQIAGAVEDVLQPYGVGVVIEAQHLCMMMRGVE